jgi:hypothetical protein
MIKRRVGDRESCGYCGFHCGELRVEHRSNHRAAGFIASIVARENAGVLQQMLLCRASSYSHTLPVSCCELLLLFGLVEEFKFSIRSLPSISCFLGAVHGQFSVFSGNDPVNSPRGQKLGY